MFKKFFNWIKSIFNKINEMKLSEFRKCKNIYYVPEDFHTNPKYRTFDELHSVNNKTIIDKINEFIMRSEFNRNIIRVVLFTIGGIAAYCGTRKVIIYKKEKV